MLYIGYTTIKLVYYIWTLMVMQNVLSINFSSTYILRNKNINKYDVEKGVTTSKIMHV